MKRYRFRLDSVRRVRQIEQDAAQAALVAARDDLDDSEAERDRAAARYEVTSDRAGTQSAAGWLAERCRADRSAAELWAAEVARNAAHDELLASRVALTDARTRTSALDRLDERRREEHRRETLREEEAAADELVSARHRRTS